MATAGEVLASLALGGMIGIASQAIRAIVGLRKTAVENETGSLELDSARLCVSFLLAFVIGIVGVLVLGLDSFSSADLKLILALAAFAYIGTDLVEALLGFSSRMKGLAKPRSPAQPVGGAAGAGKSSGAANLSTDAKIAFDLPEASILAGVPGRSIPQKSEDVQSCVSQWLQDNKGVSSADSRNLNKNISDFRISTNNEMEQFIGGVAQCLRGKKYTYVAVPAQDSPDWNSHVAKLLNGTLSTLVRDFVTNIS